MSLYGLGRIIKKNAESWMQNLDVVATRKQDIPIIQILCSYSRLPTTKTLIDWYPTLLGQKG